MTDGPKDPFAEGHDSVVMLHEIFIQLVAGGFTEDQAMRLIVGLLAEQMRGQ